MTNRRFPVRRSAAFISRGHPKIPGASGADNTEDRRQFSEASERNKGPILDVLKRVLPERGLVLEIGSGTGRHGAHFAPRLPGIIWQPSDRDPESFASIGAWAQEAGSGVAATGNQQQAAAPNLRRPVVLDVTEATWTVTEAAAVFSANMIHIAPWECCLGLLAGAGRILTTDPGGSGVSPGNKPGGSGVSPGNKPGGSGVSPGNKPGQQTTTTAGVLILYGPFKRHGRHTAPSNESFDESLRARDPAWGVRDLDAVADAAAARGLALAETVEMPANNLIAVFQRRG